MESKQEKQILDAVKKALNCVSKDQLRAVLTGVYFHCQDNELNIVDLIPENPKVSNLPVLSGFNGKQQFNNNHITKSITCQNKPVNDSLFQVISNYQKADQQKSRQKSRFWNNLVNFTMSSAMLVMLVAVLTSFFNFTSPAVNFADSFVKQEQVRIAKLTGQEIKQDIAESHGSKKSESQPKNASNVLLSLLAMFGIVKTRRNEMELIDVTGFDNKILSKLFGNHIPKCKVIENHKNMNIKQIIIDNPNDSIIIKNGFNVYLINFNQYYCQDYNLDIFDKIIWTNFDKQNLVTQIEFKNMRGF